MLAAMLRLNPHIELHPLFETIGYTLGFAVYRWARRTSGDVLNEGPTLERDCGGGHRWRSSGKPACSACWSKRLAFVSASQIVMPGGGKTIVGGLLGGWLSGLKLRSTLSAFQDRGVPGDLFAIPLCIGIGVGRVGCLLAGLADDTYGTPTSLPWGVDFGDGISRHPVQAYEILFLAALAVTLLYVKHRSHENGLLFRLFMTAYLTWRLLVDFLKPEPLVGGMNLIQWGCVGGLAVLISARLRLFLTQKRVSAGAYVRS